MMKREKNGRGHYREINPRVTEEMDDPKLVNEHPRENQRVEIQLEKLKQIADKK